MTPEPPPRAAIWGHCTSGTPLPLHPRVPTAPGLILPGPIAGGGQLLGQIFWDEAPLFPVFPIPLRSGHARRSPTGGHGRPLAAASPSRRPGDGAPGPGARSSPKKGQG